MKLTEFESTDDWLVSPERAKALKEFMGDFFLYDLTTDPIDPDYLIIPFGPEFRNSKEFANARHAYRERINGKENDN